MALGVVVLAAAGVLPRWPGLVHLVALPPLDLYTDLGMLFVHAPSYPLFLGGVAASVGFRSVVLALLLGGLDRRRLGFALGYYLLALPPSLFGAAVAFAGPATLFYLLAWAGIAVGVLALAALGAVPWMERSSLWQALARAGRRGLRLDVVLAYLALLMLLGMAADVAGLVGTLLLTPASALLTLAAARLVAANGRFLGWRLAGTAAALLVVALVTALFVASPEGPPEEMPARAPLRGSLFIMSGVDSASGLGAIFEVRPQWLGYTCEQTYYHSYAGPGAGQPQRMAACPIRTGAPYQPEDTLRSIHELVPEFAEQVDGLPEPVTVLAHSQAAWVVWEALARERVPGVEAVVLVGPFPENPVAYPPDGARGPGRVGGDVLALVSRLARPGGTTSFDPQAPLAAELLASPRAVARLMGQPLPPGVRALNLPSFSDLPFLHGGWRIPGAVDMCPVPVLHPHLPWSPLAIEAMADFLHGEPLPPCPVWVYALGPLARPFGVPPTDA